MKTQSILIGLIGFILSFYPSDAGAQVDNKVLEKIQESYIAGKYENAYILLEKEFLRTNNLFLGLLLGELYMSGMGTKQNLEKADSIFRWISTVEVNSPMNDEDREAICRMKGYAYRSSALISIIKSGNNMDEHVEKNIIDMFKKAVELSDDVIATKMLGEHYVLEYEKKTDEYQKGLDYLKSAAQRNSIEALCLLAEISEDLRDMDTAMLYWTRAANVDISIKDSANLLSGIVNPNPNKKDAEENKNRAIYALAKVYSDVLNYEEALIWLEKLTIEAPKYLNLKGLCYSGINKELSLKAFYRSLELKEDSNVYHLLGMFYKELWDDEEMSRKSLMKAIELGNKKAEKCYESYYGTSIQK